MIKLGRIERFILTYCAKAEEQPVACQDLLLAYYGRPLGEPGSKRYRLAQATFSRAVKTLAKKGYVLLVDRCECRFDLQAKRAVAILGVDLAENPEAWQGNFEQRLKEYFEKQAERGRVPFPFVKAVQLTEEGLKKVAE